ncbi:MAG: hypothetical protein WEA99_14655 [Brumimicrobium sp.]
MISQYIETNSGTDPKGIEVFNYSGTAIDFSATPLNVHQGTNGGGCNNIAGASVTSGILQPGEVWVIGTSDLTAEATTNGTNLSGTTDYGFAFNGDDALQIYLDGVLMDVFGTCGSDPGASWSGGGVSTANQNIQILNGICTGTTSNWTDPSLRFETVSSDPVNDLDGFGDAPNCSTNSIQVDAVSALTFNTDCTTGDNGSLDFTSTGVFNAGNEFTIELSDETGSFTSTTTIGSLFLDGTDPSGTINFNIPAGTNSGTAYRMRVVSDAPATIGTDNGIDIEIINNPCTITVSSISDLYYEVDCDTADTGSLDFTSSGVFNAGNTFTVELSDASGDFTSATSIGTLSLDGTDPSGTIDFTIPAGTPSGTGYRVRIVSDDPSVTGDDNGTDIEIVYEVCPSTLPASGGLLINEFSNGSTGSQEFYEFIVAGQCGETVDVRGYIIDDNNGTFTTDYNNPGGTGIALGHLRLTNHAQWSDIPVGSVVVVYNEDDPNPSLPADDPFDSDNDSLYVIPHNNTTLFEIYSDIPNANDPDSTYTPATTASTSWNPLGIANGGDAIQVRMPDGTYFHGVSYGGSEISGGPDGTKIKNSGMGGENGSFTAGDFKDPNNWLIGSAPTDETPGTFNNASNEEWLRLMRDPLSETCPVTPLPITLVLFEGEYKNGQTELYWESSSEQDNNYYELFHSTSGYDFESITKIQGAGSVSHSIKYEFNHTRPRNGINYYQLNSVDYDGTIHQKGIIAVTVNINEVYYDNISGSILFPNKEKYSIYSTSGQLVAQADGELQKSFNKKGIFLVINQERGTSTKIVVP